MSDRYEYIVNFSNDLITLINRDYCYDLVNDAYCRQIGRPREELLGASVPDVWGTDTFESVIRPRLEQCFTGETVNYIDCFPFGSVQRHMQVYFYPFRRTGEDISHVLVISEDVTVLTETEAKLAEFEYRDQLTGLYNRNTMEITLEQQLRKARRHAGEGALVVLFVSMHNFKSINRTHGHQIGDLILSNSAMRLSECVRESDFVFRFDSANFVTLLTDIKQDIDASIVAQKIHESITLPYRLDTADIRVNCRIGIAVYPRDATTAGKLVQNANSACVEAEEHDEPFLFFDEDLHHRAVSRAQLHTQLQRAFEHQEFELFYQPILEMSDGSVRWAGAEALIRWNHPTHGLLAPDRFIALAEATRVVKTIDTWVLFSVCERLAELREIGDYFISANLSAISFASPELRDVVERAVSEAELSDARGLRLELTERMSLPDPKTLLAQILELQKLGLQVWIDDFGVGQSSLALLKRIPAQGIKIDHSFLEESSETENDRAYLGSIVAGIAAQRRDAIVEGVSDVKKYQIARTLGCRYLQGYYLGRPVPFHEILHLLQSDPILES
ncbi:MAG: phosphodiesterase [Spirochaetaceae bacterium]|nr:MAG: phosphodiesterase [Spirochaetaceae bacterium]